MSAVPHAPVAPRLDEPLALLTAWIARFGCVQQCRSRTEHGALSATEFQVYATADGQTFVVTVALTRTRTAPAMKRIKGEFGLWEARDFTAFAMVSEHIERAKMLDLLQIRLGLKPVSGDFGDRGRRDASPPAGPTEVPLVSRGQGDFVKNTYPSDLRRGVGDMAGLGLDVTENGGGR